MRVRLVLALVVVSACTRHAPSWSAVGPGSTLEVLGARGPVSLARVRLEALQTFRFEASACQEVMVLVEAGVARASLSWIEQGRAARFRAPTVLQAMSETGATLFAVTVSRGPLAAREPSWNAAPDGTGCLATSPAIVLSDPARSGPFLRTDGRLSVMIYLDGKGQEPPVASLGTLSGDATLDVPPHIHETSAEVLWVQRGSGTMQLGDASIQITPNTLVYVPPGIRHGFEPDGRDALFAYQVYTPSGPEERFRR